MRVGGPWYIFIRNTGTYRILNYRGLILSGELILKMRKIIEFLSCRVKWFPTEGYWPDTLAAGFEKAPMWGWNRSRDTISMRKEWHFKQFSQDLFSLQKFVTFADLSKNFFDRIYRLRQGEGSQIPPSLKLRRSKRGVAQLVAYYVRDVGAGSSSLLTPTYKITRPL